MELARPNEGKTEKYIFVRISPKLYKLLLVRKNILANNGERFARKASIADISDEFVDHYWKIAEFSVIGKAMKKEFDKTVIKNV